MTRILVVRSDRLGDVILSTPVLEALQNHFASCQLTFLVRPFVIPVLKGLPTVQSFISYEPEGRHRGIKGSLRLFNEIRSQSFDYAIILQSEARISTAIYLSGIPVRIGPLSKFHSYFLFNRGVRQNRSKVQMHETEYNLNLLKPLGVSKAPQPLSTRVYISPGRIQEARQWLESQGWNSGDRLIQVHPGMGGSALNWPQTHYLELIQSLIQEGHKVLITGGPTEGKLLESFKTSLGHSARNQVFFFSASSSQFRGQSTDPITLDFLGALSTHCQLVIAPSTGPLHLARALGRPVVTFYPPIRVQSAKRWGPYPLNPQTASVLTPQVECGQAQKCIGSACSYFPCMESISVKSALNEVRYQLKNYDNKT